MAAFAANSLLCRAALSDTLRAAHIDPASFGAIRVTSGALVLACAMRLRSRPAAAPDWRAAVMLFAYVAAFSFAYLTLPAGTGALILFGAVQLTMFAAGLARGERFALAGWAGLALAAAGLVVLVLPGVAAPPPGGAALMAVAGAAWGAYSLRGRGVPDPLAATASNFLLALPLALLLGAVFVARAHADVAGVLLAIASGALTSGLGYVIWYAALRGLSALQAASVQLSVPVIAACGGTLWLDEAFTPRLAVAVVAILGGIALVLTDRARGRIGPGTGHRAS
ncbi:DMT family transporter [Massilia putida]|uniref:DMT family transporter n=1 Tax=Massilia putida TaxID=1141883 RepID=UPI0009FB58DC|nr:DMT family transporter [Massilia putida]